MTKASADAPATHFRLEAETWALAIEDYKNGATAKEVGAKWMVAPSSVYRQAALMGAGKRNVGDARARAHARLVEEEEAAHRAMNPVGSRALKGLFRPAPAEDHDASDPAALARAATLASGRAMKGRLWAEAKALAGLAESYARLADRQAAVGMDAYNVPLRVVAEVLDDAGGTVSDRLRIRPDRTFDPDLPVKLLWRERCRQVEAEVAAGREAGLSEEKAWERALDNPAPSGRGRGRGRRSSATSR
ncbi:hypothetical protein ACETK8_04520 [Brevundimonas staleyi]|uniref:Terminase small subunit n=1 Tax=Brevundimonas staleyi TaxID=74326 RepID=A0ABW0FX48_9CAUL